MEDRYEIRRKIGQGGVGAVYLALDSRMKREVAIKRILPDATPDLQAEATSQLIREAGSLAALQHPHIVTVYDIGTDKDGPYVVMELITGKTLDELIARAPLTWPDFRQLALQSQEALIAAQDHDIVHRDLKPSNVMLTWLPSGKIQVKIVDFGLAKFTPRPSPQTLDQNNSVFGSIFFMAPEQFERGLIDFRTDHYAIGCVYYHALTGQHPFDGETGPQVMVSHLRHLVTPLQDIRPDLPRWACDWVMWHINRYPADRPEHARQALQIFLQNDSFPTPVPAAATVSIMTTGPQPPAPDSPKRPRLIIPGAAAPAPEPTPAPAPPVEPAPLVTQTAPQPLMPPEGSRPSVHAAAETAPVPAAEYYQPTAAPPAQPAPAPEYYHQPAAPPAQPAPAPEYYQQPAAPPSQPVPAYAPPPQAYAPPAPPAQAYAPPAPPAQAYIPPAQPVPAYVPPAQAVPAAIPVARPVVGSRLAPGGMPTAAPGPNVVYGARPGTPSVGLPLKPKTGMSSSAKATIAALLAITVIILAVVFVKQSSRNAETKEYNAVMKRVGQEGVTEIPLNSRVLDILLNTASSVGVVEQREAVYTALFLAKATDGTDIDARITEFVTTQPMQPDVRQIIIANVLSRRANPKIVPSLLKFARSTPEVKSAIAALATAGGMATEAQFGEFLEVVKLTTEGAVRTAAEDAISEILAKSENRTDLGSRLATTYQTSVNDDLRHSMIRLLARAGGPTSEEIVRKSLNGEDKKEQIAAIRALGSWIDNAMFETLIEFLEEQTEDELRRSAFDSGFRFLTSKERTLSDEDSEDFWKLLARNAKTRVEKERIINGLANSEINDWAVSVIEYFIDESDDDAIINRAEMALDRMRERAKTQGGNDDDDDD